MRVGITATARRIIPELATATTRHMMLAAAVVLLLAGHAHAQVTCSDADASQSGSGTTSSYFQNCDMQYKNTELMCDTFKVRGACPSQPMMMKTTPQRSFIKDFSPYLYAYARDPDDRSRPYSGVRYRGTPGDAAQTFGLVCPPGRRCPASCLAQIKFPTEARSPEEEAKMVRMQLDNCANQYILYSAIYPFQKENSTILSGENPANGAERMSLETSCQPIDTVPDTKNEYFASEYLKAAWIKLMQDPGYRKNPKAPKEPHLPTGMTIDNPIPPPAQFPDVRTSHIGAIKFEEINDPTHPFSPRWDFEFNERDHYSPMTASYSGDPRNAVFCAGDKDKQILKVDILSFREAALKFDDKITKRIEFNKNCKANSGPQKNPCCLPSGPLGQTCKLQPCAKCYAMTQESPVCSTSYTGTPDRKRVKAPYLPVHPALRVVGAVQSLSSLSLSNLNQITGGVLNVAQATGLISSQLSILNALPGNLPLSQVMPLLTGQVNLISALPNLAPDILSAALGGQSALLNMLPGNLTMSQVTALMNGQGNVLRMFEASAGLPIGSVKSIMKSPQNILNMMPSNSVLGDARQLIMQQTATVRNFVQQGRSVVQTVNDLETQARELENTNPNILLQDAAADAAKRGVTSALNYRGLGLPGNMSVGQARQVIISTSNSLQEYDPNGSLTQYSDLLNSQASHILGLPQDLPVTQISSMLGSAQGLIDGNNILLAGGSKNGILNTQNLGKVTSVINGQIQGLTGLPSNITTGQLNGIITGQASVMQVLGKNFSPSQISNMLTQQMGEFGKVANMAGQVQGLANSLTTGNISGLLNSQLGALSNLPGASTLSSVAGVVDTGIFGGVPGVGGLPGPSAKNTLPTLVVLGMPYSRTAKCNPNEFGDANQPPMAELCTALRAPFTPLNKLRMRYHNPNDSDTIVFKEGVPEGYSFHEYFKDENPNNPAHMPYPRLWDTGRSIQKVASDQQNAKDDSGQWTTIVGIGHEATPGNANPPSGESRADKAKALRMKDQRCLYGGWGGNVSMGGTSITLPDPIASWTELKLYQARTLRDVGISCLGRYEKTAKLGSNEDKALFAFGADPAQVIISRNRANGAPETVTLQKWREENPGKASPTDLPTQIEQKAFPLAWRGYVGAYEDAFKFPNFPNATPSMETGLDKAKPGDILVMENGASGDNSKRSLPRLAYVESVQKDEYVYVLEADNGKWPDVCGTTDTWGELKTRYLYKPGKLPSDAKLEYERLGWTSDCADGGLSECEARNWSSIKVYRPTTDIRKANDGSEMKSPPARSSTP